MKWLKHARQDDSLTSAEDSGGGGQFKRVIGVVKRSLYKSIGNWKLSWHELEELILDIETILNDRPLDYVECDV